MSIKSNWMRGDLAPAKARKGVSNKGAMTRDEKIRDINRKRNAQTRRGIAAEIIADARREIEAAKEHRKNVGATRKAVDAAAAETLAANPEAKLKIVRTKAGVTLQVRNKGKFQPSVKIAA